MASDAFDIKKKERVRFRVYEGAAGSVFGWLSFYCRYPSTSMASGAEGDENKFGYVRPSSTDRNKPVDRTDRARDDYLIIRLDRCSRFHPPVNNRSTT